jgi:hypothetical protein
VTGLEPWPGGPWTSGSTSDYHPRFQPTQRDGLAPPHSSDPRSPDPARLPQTKHVCLACRGLWAGWCSAALAVVEPSTAGASRCTRTAFLAGLEVTPLPEGWIPVSVGPRSVRNDGLDLDLRSKCLSRGWRHHMCRWLAGLLGWPSLPDAGRRSGALVTAGRFRRSAAPVGGLLVGRVGQGPPGGVERGWVRPGRTDRGS